MSTATATGKERFLELLDRAAPSAKFQALRQMAGERFRLLPLPTLRTEDWRFTSIAPLLNLPIESAAAPMKPAALPAPTTPEALRLVFINGVFQNALSTRTDLPAGVYVGPLAEAPADRLQPWLGRVAECEGLVFTALNTALLHDGAAILVPAGHVLERPVEVVYLAQSSAQRAAATAPRTLLVAGRGSQMTVIERYLDEGGAGFTNAVTEAAVAEGAFVDHYKLLDEQAQGVHFGNTQALLAGRSNFRTHYLALGGGLVRNEVRVRFDGEGAEATVNGLYLGTGTQHLDNFTVIDHARPHCASHELYKGVLDGQAQGVFNGKIFVRPDAQKTDAKQTNQVLLLSDGATINTKPQLEIFADDVKCTHGAAVGQLDAEQLFYLRSRGIGAEAARALLTFAFANDVVGRIRVEALREQLEARIVR